MIQGSRASSRHGDNEPTTEDKRDSELVLQAQSGSEVALVTILRKYSPAARAKGYKFFVKGGETDDVIQEAMIGLFKAVRDFDPNRCAKFRVFASLCINRQVMTAVKLAGRNKHGPLNEAGSLDETGGSSAPLHLAAGSSYDPAALAAAKLDLEELRRLLSRELSAIEAATLQLYIRGESYEEIAEHLGARIKTVDNAIQRVRSKVRSYLRTKDLAEASPPRELSLSH